MLTVLMATYNRADLLSLTLDRFTKLDSPRGGWKLVVIDNGSRDRSKETILSFQTRLPITYLFEKKQGKNAALNKGLNLLAGDLVIFTDDDALPNKDWLVRYREIADARPEYSAFGGPILPFWQAPPPQWILDWVPLGQVFALSSNFSEGPTDPSFIWGANMAIRSTVFSSVRRFNEHVGPQGKSYAMGSETEFLFRIQKEKYRLWFHEKAIVKHLVRADQMTMKWILNRATRCGRGDYRLEFDHTQHPPKIIFGVPRYLIRNFLEQLYSVMRALFSINRKRLFQERFELNRRIGFLMESRILYREMGPNS